VVFPFVRENPSNSRYSRHLPIGIRRKNLPLTPIKGEGVLMADVMSIISDYKRHYIDNPLQQLLCQDMVKCVKASHEADFTYFDMILQMNFR